LHREEKRREGGRPKNSGRGEAAIAERGECGKNGAVRAWSKPYLIAEFVIYLTEKVAFIWQRGDNTSAE
jgi:hypothetical protein